MRRLLTAEQRFPATSALDYASPVEHQRKHALAA
jgi:hypothetical protein